MHIYLVGGAVRDKLLDLPVKERDWVVVGTTPAEMVQQGFKPVGKEFPVFIHPHTKEEYALARTERKTAKGYKGFEFYASPEVTLEEDLRRRDLTINAMAEDAQGHLIDPYHGQADLQKKQLRHVSPAFAEDPVRILRLARFATRFPTFSVHPETLRLMQMMVKAGEVEALVPERVFKELARSLEGEAPERFFDVLTQTGALPILFPDYTDFDQAALKNATALTHDPVIRWAAFLHPVSPHAIEALNARYRLPTEYAQLALLISKYYNTLAQGNQLDAEARLSLLHQLDALRRYARFHRVLLACQAAGLSSPLVHEWEQVQKTVKAVDYSSLLQQGLTGADFAEALKILQLAAIKKG